MAQKQIPASASGSAASKAPMATMTFPHDAITSTIRTPNVTHSDASPTLSAKSALRPISAIQDRA